MSVALSLLVCVSLIASSGNTLASEQDKLNNLRQRISVLQQELEKTSESKSDAADALRESERAISISNRALATLAQQQRSAKQALGQLQQQTQKLSADMHDQQVLLGKLLYQQYLGGKQEYLKLLLNNRDPNRIAREIQYYEYIARRRASWVQKLRKNLAQLDEITGQTLQTSEEIAALQKEEKSQRQILDKDKIARQTVLHRYAKQIKQQRREIGRLQRDENRLSRLVDQLSAMLTQPKGKGLFNNDQLPDSRFDDKPFEQLKGKLVLPVKGVVTNKYGTARPDSTVLWKGLQLQAAAGQTVRAVAAGRVVFADWLPLLLPAAPICP